MSVSEIRERWCRLLGRSRISLTLNAGYGRLRLPIRLSNSPVLQKVKRRSAPVHALGQGGALSLCLSLPKKIEGDGAPTRRMAWITPDRPGVALISGRARIAGPWGETSPPAPCSAPPSIFGLTPYQRSGHTRSYLSLEGCSRGRPWVGLRLPYPQVPSRSPPYERLRKAPLESGSG